ncbi:MAG: DegT/DnrJ/EryC1/StrS family aminotransferase [Verrucomicrobia bacterium]|nr:DegT/DnrJ/EryC1/StrS family aminotransferase [Verrucomicrobiota bacterium]
MKPYFKQKPYPLEFSGAAMIGAEEKELVNRVLDSRSLNRYYGPANQGMVADFEREAATWLGVKHTLAVHSGSGALRVALRALDIGPGDEILVPASTFIATALAVLNTGATTVFVEIDESGNINPNDIEHGITTRTKALIVVPILGVPCDMDSILAIVRRRKLLLLEDCAQSFGCRYHGRPVGSFGDIGCFSLQHCKVITSGEGGLVATSNPSLYERMIRLHDQGFLREAHLPNLGRVASTESPLGENYRMSELTGAVALAQLRKLDRIVAKLKENRRRIYSALQPGPYRFRPSPDPDGDVGCNLLFIHEGTGAQMDEWVHLLCAEGIPAGCRYDGKTVYQYSQIRAIRNPDGTMRFPDGLCPRTEHILQVSAHVPVAPQLTAEDCLAVADAINRTTDKVYSPSKSRCQLTVGHNEAR